MAVSSQRRPAGRLFFRRYDGCQHALRERPRPRHGHCCPQASIQAAVGVGRPLPQNPDRAHARRIGAIPVGAALAATRPLLSAGSDPGRRRGRKTPPTESRPGLGSCLTHRRNPCGSARGRDMAAAVRRLRSRLLSGSEDPSHRIPAPARLMPDASEQSLWERPWPRHDRCCPQASIRAAVGVRGPLPQNPGPGSAHARRIGAIPVGAALAATRPLLSASFDPGRCRGQKTPPTEPRPRQQAPR